MTDASPDHKEREHSNLGASSCSRWWNCPGSLRLSEGIPITNSVYAEEGTAAHELAHLCLLKGQYAQDFVDRKVNDHDVTPEMAEAVQVYLDVCWEYRYGSGECWTERKFSLKALKPPAPMFGTADFVAYNSTRKVLTVVDLKYGKGIAVEAQDNPQLKYYALGALLAMPPNTEVREIETVIVQPRAPGDPVKRARYEFMDLYTWAEDLLEHARATMVSNAPLNPGKWCRFCPASGRCPAEADKSMAIAQQHFSAERPPEIRLLTPEQMSDLLTRAPLIEQFIKSLREAAKGLLEQDADCIPGWKLVDSYGHRKWANPDTTAERLTALLGLEEQDIWTREIVSPAKAEAAGVKKLRELGMKAKDAKEAVLARLADLTVKPVSGANLVRTEDNRPALPASVAALKAEPPPPALPPGLAI